MSDALPPLPEPREVLELWGQNLNVYDEKQMHTYAVEAVRAALAQPAPQPAPTVPEGWVMVTERMPQSGVVVLACYRNSAGNLRRIRAEFVAAKTQQSGDESDIGVYDEAIDTYYDPEGWYEQIDNWDDGFSAIGVHQGDVTHWMPLPAAPQEPQR